MVVHHRVVDVKALRNAITSSVPPSDFWHPSSTPPSYTNPPARRPCHIAKTSRQSKDALNGARTRQRTTTQARAQQGADGGVSARQDSSDRCKICHPHASAACLCPRFAHGPLPSLTQARGRIGGRSRDCHVSSMPKTARRVSGEQSGEGRRNLEIRNCCCGHAAGQLEDHDRHVLQPAPKRTCTTLLEGLCGEHPH